MKKLLYTLFGIVIGALMIFGIHSMAKVVEVPDALSYVDFSQGTSGYERIGKMYDSNANVACYILFTTVYSGNAISCVSLK